MKIGHVIKPEASLYRQHPPILLVRLYQVIHRNLVALSNTACKGIGKVVYMSILVFWFRYRFFILGKIRLVNTFASS
jgi:hypothetical protein